MTFWLEYGAAGCVLGTHGQKTAMAEGICRGHPYQRHTTGREGIPAIKALIEDILDWPLAEGTEFQLAEAVHMREFPT